MSWFKAAEYPADIDLAQIDKQLHSERVQHRFTMESGVQVLWLMQTEDAEQVLQRVQSWLDNPETIPRPQKIQQSRIQLNTKPAPLTLGLLFLSFVGTALPFFGMEFIQPFTFWDAADRLVFGESGFRDIAAGEYWRLITPIFLHFGLTHIIFNALFLWYLGSMIENHSGVIRLATLTVLIALVSNVAQAVMSESNVIFGGMSGVVFGLFSYVWVAQKISKVRGYSLSNPLFFFMTGYMILSTFGLFNWLAGGDIADTAHISGYITGIVSAFVIYLIQMTSKDDSRRTD